ncbi:MAG: Methionine aminopeptidase 1 [Firmicutes bacterium ADurb.Bin248]|mgnify:CR=1 FL=1|nr:MAG: Methionine aminopeptidase 1 [Firmicutes bacterium ADurb.Bin248]HOF99638.1 type I methionyl aminopeptidase [Clostridia bacterium]
MSRLTVKNAAEIAKMRAAGLIVRDALELLGRSAKAGVSTLELDAIAAEFLGSRGAKASFLGYNGYPASICASVNSQVVHGIPDGYKLREGDILSVDIGALKDGYHGDAARTFFIGRVADEARKLVEVTQECFFLGAAEAREGRHIADISRAVEAHARKHGYGVVRDLVGHGIGRDMHEPPEVPNFTDARIGRGLRLTKGMTLAIEPMINMGGWQVRQEANGWTVVTADGSLSAHYENTVAITDGEAEILTL